MVLAAWLRGAALAPFGLGLIIYVAMSLVCGDSSSECSWGFEFLLVIPVAFWTFLVSGPARVGDRVALACGEEAAARARWTAGLAAVVALALLLVLPGSGLPGFYAALALACLGVPAVVVWRVLADRSPR